jgi:hypothetical protein
MKKLALVLGGGLAAVVLVWALIMGLPTAAFFLRVTLESLMPSTIGWNAKNDWAKCEGAIAGTVDWPPSPVAACAAMHLCANEATLSTEEAVSLLAGNPPPARLW